MLTWLANRRQRLIARHIAALAASLPSDGVLCLPAPMRWHCIRDLGGMGIISQEDCASWLWRLWRAYRCGELWQRNPEFVEPSNKPKGPP